MLAIHRIPFCCKIQLPLSLFLSFSPTLVISFGWEHNKTGRVGNTRGAGMLAREKVVPCATESAKNYCADYLFRLLSV